MSAIQVKTMHNLNYLGRIVCFKKSRLTYILSAALVLLILLLIFSTKVIDNEDGTYDYVGRFPFSIVVTNSLGLTLLPFGLIILSLGLPLPLSYKVASRELYKLQCYINAGDINRFKEYFNKTKSNVFLKRYYQMIDCEIDFYEGSLHMASRKVKALLETTPQYEKELTYLDNLITCGLHKNIEHYQNECLNSDSYLKTIEELSSENMYTLNTHVYQETLLFLTDFIKFKQEKHTLYQNALVNKKENRYGDERENY